MSSGKDIYMEKADRYPDRLHHMLLLLHSDILLLCSLAAAYVSLGFVLIKNLLDRKIQGSVAAFKLFGNILMHRRLTYPEFFRGASYGITRFGNIPAYKLTAFVSYDKWSHKAVSFPSVIRN